MQNDLNYRDGIDLREIILTLWKGRWVIIFSTMIVTVSVFVISKWVITEKYQAKTFLLISGPKVMFADLGDISINFSMPEIRSLVELAEEEGILEKVITAPEIKSIWDIDMDSIMDMIEVSSVGENQIKFQVVDINPERARLLANIWAEEIASKINTLYGLDIVTQKIKPLIIQAQEKYNQTQIALEDELFLNELVIINAKIRSSGNGLDCVLIRSSAAKRILEDLQVLEQNLTIQTGREFLSLGNVLSLTTLQQRASASNLCASSTQMPQLQIVNETLIVVTVLDALETISQMQEALETQQPVLDKEQTRLEEESISLQFTLENTENQLFLIKNARDQARALYLSLIQQESQISTSTIAGGDVATVFLQSYVNDEPYSPNIMTNSAVGFFIGLMLGVFCVYVPEWWQKNGDINKPEEEKVI